MQRSTIHAKILHLQTCEGPTLSVLQAVEEDADRFSHQIFIRRQDVRCLSERQLTICLTISDQTEIRRSDLRNAFFIFSGQYAFFHI